jgi:hypothetical protein
MLAMGGSALGEAVKSSGLLLSITQARGRQGPASLSLPVTNGRLKCLQRPA